MFEFEGLNAQSPGERLQVEAKLDHRFEQTHDSGFQLISSFSR